MKKKPNHLGVSKNRGTPKGMAKIMENPIQMDELGGTPTIFGNIHLISPQFVKEFLEIKKLFGQDLLEGGQVTWDKTCRFFPTGGKKNKQHLDGHKKGWPCKVDV